MAWILATLIALLYILTPKEVTGTPPTYEYNRMANVIIAPRFVIVEERKTKETNNIPRPTVSGNCVSTLRRLGYHVPRTRDGYARSIPVAGKEIKKGEVKVAVTYEGPVGHVVAVKKVGDKLVSVAEGNHSVGVGRIVSWGVVKGFVN